MTERGRPSHMADLLGVTGLLLLLLVAACRGGAVQPSDGKGKAAAPGAARTTAERGPVKFVVECSPAPCRLSDEVTLTLTIEAVKGVKVDPPPFGKAFGDFLIRDFREPLPEVRGGRRVIRQIYTLEPTRTGNCFIQPIRVNFTDDRANGDGKEHFVESESLEIEVTSVLGEEAPSLEALRPPAGPMELPMGSRLPWAWAGAALLVLTGGAFFLFRRRRRRAVPLEARLSPRERAYLELKRILEEHLAERDLKEFYVELTGIVRRYIEDTTGIRAPEQTTEEFLHEMEGRAVFQGEERLRLREFLESADLVKFAAFRPDKEEVERSFERAKAFVGLSGEEGEEKETAA